MICTACAGEADIAFAIDASGSIAFNDWKVVVSFITRVVTDMFIANEGVNIAVVTYGGKSSQLICFNQ